MMKKLKYTGPGFVPGYPAKDIEVDAETAEALVAGGAYAYPEPVKKPTKSDKPAGKDEK